MNYTKGEKYKSELTGEVYEYDSDARDFVRLKTDRGYRFDVSPKIFEALKLVPYKKPEPEYLVGMFGKFSGEGNTEYGFLVGFNGDSFRSNLSSWDNFTPFDEPLLAVNKKWEALRDGN